MSLLDVNKATTEGMNPDINYNYNKYTNASREVTFETNTTQNGEVQETCGVPASIYILNNVILTPNDEEDAERARKRRKKAAAKKYRYFDIYDEVNNKAKIKSFLKSF